MNISEKRKGAILMLCAAFCFSAMSAFIRLSGDLPVMQKTFFRNAVAVLVISADFLRKKKKISIQKQCLPYHFIRSGAGTLAIIGNFYAVDRMVLSDATMLTQLMPFFAIVFSALMLKERAEPYQWGAIAIALTGAMFIIKPSPQIFEQPAFLSAIAAAVCGGVAYTTLRYLGNRGEDGQTIILFFSVFSCIVCIPFMLFNYVPITSEQFWALMGAASCGCCGQFLVTAAYRCAPVSDISVFDYSQIVFTALFGWLFFRQVADRWSYVGYAIIICAAVLVFLLNQNQQKRQAKIN